MQNKLKIISALAAVGCICLFGMAAGDKQEPKVKWMESPMTSFCEIAATNSAGEPTSWTADSALRYKTIPDAQIGLRDDGVVVWRKR